jgi:pumilio RNA-binding family
VQLALEVSDQSDQAYISGELHGCVRRAIASPHGNYVIQKIILELPTALTSFVIEELFGIAAEASRHRYGCRIVCRLLEHSATDAMVVQLVEEILVETMDLCCHNFGHHVIQTILEHGHPAHKHTIAETLRAQSHLIARNRNAAYVAERALTYCSPADQQALTTTLLSQPQLFVALAENQFGFHVVLAALRLPGEISQAVRSLMLQSSARLEVNKYGIRVLDDLTGRSNVSA